VLNTRICSMPQSVVYRSIQLKAIRGVHKIVICNQCTVYINVQCIAMCNQSIAMSGVRQRPVYNNVRTQC
jgi:hypothetical protein